MFGGLKLAMETKAWLRSMEQEKKPMTKADRIRALSDEELEWAIDPAIVPPGMTKREWLKQPAEVE